ncbi:MAG: 1,4-dihydroxy-6-naphthoate synthase [Bacteroidetes bacterium]|nr:MAG: 1,4-dihydroxy-6-naphthoate synthase [Bacteroidota bacterium]
MKLKLGISTCPNDTFMFDAMLHNKIDTEGLSFDLLMADVEELNKRALNKSLDVTKLSYHAYCYLSDNYVLLDSGSALGYKNGPLLISKHKVFPDEIDSLRIAIPGKLTTANLLLSIAYPKAQNKLEYVFSDIEEVVLSNECDAGLIIHENRFTYKEKGLRKVIDLGEYWEQKTNLPIPLGAIAVNRELSADIQQKINRVLRKSIEYAFENPESSYDFVKQNAQEMERDVMNKHINLYVNKFSINLGDEGKKSINELFSKAQELNIVPKIKNQFFINK